MIGLPEAVALFPLPNHVLLPGLPVPFRVFEPRYRQLVADLLEMGKDARFIAMPPLLPGWQAGYEGSPAFHPVCALALVRRIHALDGGQFLISVDGLVRCRLSELPSPHPYRLACPTALPEPRLDLTIEQLRLEVGRICTMVRTWSLHQADMEQHLEALLREDGDHAATLERLGCLLVESADQRQAFLECERLGGRLAMLRSLADSTLPGGRRDGLRPSEN